MESDILNIINQNISLGNELNKILDNYKKIPGVQKVQKSINQEIKFLEKAIKNKNCLTNHVQSTNMNHFSFLVKILQLQRDIVHIDCGFHLEERCTPLRVDIVCENGLKWIKAIALNPKSLLNAANGEASYGARSILDQAEEFVAATEHHMCLFQRPKVVFYFCHEINAELLEKLQKIGVETASLSDQSDENFNCNEVVSLTPSTLNLDITTLLAYISSLCNGGSNFTYTDQFLIEQAEKERQTPLKPVLDELFAGKRLICCEIAYKSFQDIINLIAGPVELQRATELMKRVEILPDITEIPEELATLKLSGQINQRSLKIFAFGINMKALTVTSNKAFIRSAKMQGINVPVFTHQARALTELKEASATKTD
ncbi:UPF0415 protein C7orf25 [Teleopsis dalmanni]|uniref:UPF0415 protein C7orf25 n=1 Tax=Teleopsis dalmanni TaxID=139649 RepID=UPI0018CDE6F1|nr:UPF0415 protein C7orf25 [Teleopsis dalmanni]